jgi:F-type H+-transporting ATPase subunit alpha
MQFGSEVDGATRATLESGKRLTEILKQRRFVPIKDELQGILVFAVSEGYAKNVAVEDMERFEKELYSFFESEKASLLLKVKNAKKMDDELRQELKNALDEFVERF